MEFSQTIRNLKDVERLFVIKRREKVFRNANAFISSPLWKYNARCVFIALFLQVAYLMAIEIIYLVDNETFDLKKWVVLVFRILFIRRPIVTIC